MNMDRAVMALAGTLTLSGITLTAFTSPWWMTLPAFVGLNLLQASITGSAPQPLSSRGGGRDRSTARAVAR
jgi:hypothetical protein